MYYRLLVDGLFVVFVLVSVACSTYFMFDANYYSSIACFPCSLESGIQDTHTSTKVVMELIICFFHTLEAVQMQPCYDWHRRNLSSGSNDERVDRS